MRASAARAVHLVLFGLGTLLYIVFVLPRWWVLTGDIPRTPATAGRIAAGIPIALAAWPILQLRQAGLRATSHPPELALRLRAWSGVLHVVAGVLILLTAITEIWLHLTTGAPWLFGVYGAAAALAVLGFLALHLSFVAEQPPAVPKPAKDKAAKKPKRDRGKAKKPTDETAVAPETDSAATEVVTTTASDTVVSDASDTDDAASEGDASDSDRDHDVANDEDTDTDDRPAALRNKRPAGKSRRWIGR
jgi:hypothetical protein